MNFGMETLRELAKLIDIEDDAITLVQFETAGSEKSEAVISIHEIKRVFEPGDHIRVGTGLHSGKQGTVVSTSPEA